MIYLYFDKTGTLKEVINDESIRRGTTNTNGLAVYCELWDDADFELDDIWYCQRLSCGKLTPEVSFIENLEIMQVPYKKDVDYTYFKDFKQYKFYVFEFTTEYTQYSGLNVGTVRFAVDDGINALGTITFNIQDNVIKEDNNITQSQYDYLLLSYASRTLNEETGRTLCELIEDIVKEQAKITGIEYVGTTTEILALTSDEGIALSTTNAHIYYWDDEQGSYVDSEIEFMDVSLSSNVMTLSGSQTVSGTKTFTGTQVFSGTTMFSGASVHSNDVEVGGDLIAKDIIGNDGTNFALNLKSGNEENKIIVDNNKVEISHDATGTIADASIILNTASILFKVANGNVLSITENEINAIGNLWANRVIGNEGVAHKLDLTSSSELNHIIVDDNGINLQVDDKDILYTDVREMDENDRPTSYYVKTGANVFIKAMCDSPTNAGDIVNKDYVDSRKRELENALSGKADLNNNEQEITAFEITTENMYVADLYQNGASITLDSAFGGISFKPSGSNKYITIGAGQIKGIDTVSNNTDATNKQYVDGINTNLQSQIDGINAGQNLADIVADLTALNNLSTTHLKVEDKVQVLVDSNHDNASTVYNWNGSTWGYIGKYGQDGYTKAEANTLLATKQNVIDSSHKLSSDLVDDTSHTNRFFKVLTSQDIFDNDLQKRNLNLMTPNSIYWFSGGDIANAPKGTTGDNVFSVICINSNSGINFPTNNYGAIQILISSYGIIYTRQSFGWTMPNIYTNKWTSWHKGGVEEKIGNFGAKEIMKGKTALMVGDSITDETYEERWCTSFSTKAKLTSYTNVAVAGSGWVYDNNGTLDTVLEQLTNASALHSGVDYIFIASGNNDVASKTDITTFATSITNALTYALTTYTNAKIVIITPIKKASNGLEDEHTQYYRNVITNIALTFNSTYQNRIKIIQGNYAPLGSDDYIPSTLQSEFYQDATHPTLQGSRILGEYIYDSVCLVEDETKLTALTNTDWAERVYTVATDGTQSVRYISLDSLPNSVVLRNSTGALNCADAVYDSHALNMGFYKATFQPKQHQIIANVNDGVSNFKALITIVSPSTIIDTATLLKTYFTTKGYNFANTTKYAVQNIYISKLNVSENGFDENSIGMIYDSNTQTFTSPNISNGASLTIVGVVSDTVKAI